MAFPLKTFAGTNQPPAWCLGLAPAGWAEVGPFWVNVVRYTPELSARVLEERNTRNRRVVVGHVVTLAAAMRRREFYLTGEPVIFANDGVLANGQHRLHACVRSGVPFDALTVAGLDPKVYYVLDQGAKRSLAQVLRQAGVEHSAIMATALNALPYYRATGQLGWSASSLRTGKEESVHTIERLLGGLELYPSLPESVAFAASFSGRGEQKNRLKMLRGRSPISILHYLFSRVDRGLADEMMRRLLTGQLGVDGDAWGPLRTLDSSLRDNLGTRRLSAGITEAFVIRAWNALRSGRELRLLRQGKNDSYPVIHGIPYVNGLPQIPGVTSDPDADAEEDAGND